jgi:serine kinase of HPr protein (carbohydrate metabolism regulator)
MTELARETVHATAVALGEAGLLIRGPSGTGKSRVALRLIDQQWQPGAPSIRLVGDDRIVLTATGQRLVARPHPTIAGRIEWRGQGLLTLPHEPAVVIRALIDLTATAQARLPDDGAGLTSLLGIPIAHGTLPVSDADPVAVIRWWREVAKL